MVQLMQLSRVAVMRGQILHYLLHRFANIQQQCNELMPMVVGVMLFIVMLNQVEQEFSMILHQQQIWFGLIGLQLDFGNEIIILLFFLQFFIGKYISINIVKYHITQNGRVGRAFDCYRVG
ncbi:Hypothetical_protein [Hexamita inflata]|uniref:Hypothetical_protein n=1 Tax=Hexamita inflata TaxID=28002 RepID=A0AA86PTM3_9EUKA|nr:Hypothetical protein HINF_LOCUS32246 [Hexamita inflata]